MMMFSSFYVFFVLFVFFCLLCLLSLFFNGMEINKSSPFECGFQPFCFSGSSFSMPFFIVSLMFLLFDVEVIIMSFPPFLGMRFFFFLWVVIFLVLVFTCYEWMMGVLSWISNFL